MSIAGEIALQPIQADGSERTFSLSVGGRRIKTESISGGYSAEAGSSDLSFETDYLLEAHEDETVRFEVGYGSSSMEYMRGILREPYDEAGGTGGSTGTAYGPFKALDYPLGEEVHHVGVPIDFAYRDLMRYASVAGMPLGAVEVRRGRTFNVEDETFTEETTILEAIKHYNDSSGFVSLDRPYMKRLFMPTPRPGATAKSKATYGPGTYSPEAFKLPKSSEKRYSKVVVFRRDENGADVVRAEAPVTNYTKKKPPPNAIYYIPEFAGDAIAARQEAYDTARMLSVGSRSFELAAIAFNPDLLLYDTIIGKRKETRGDRDLLVTYKCLIEGEITFEISREAHDMTLSGSALKTEEVDITRPVVIERWSSPGVLDTRAEPTGPSVTYYWGDPVTRFSDIADKTFEEASQ